MTLQRRIDALETKREPKHERGILVVFPNPGESREDAIERVKAECADFVRRCRKLSIFFIGITR